MPPSVVCFGQDNILVETRRDVFRSAGYQSHAVHTFEELTHWLAKHAVDVLILCHSATLEDCEKARELAHHRRDPILVLVLNQGAQGRAQAGCDASFDTPLGPKALLRAVAALLSEHGRDSHTAHPNKPEDRHA